MPNMPNKMITKYIFNHILILAIITLVAKITNTIKSRLKMALRQLAYSLFAIHF